MTSAGRVVDRAEANRIADAAEQGQASRPGSLKSEDIASDRIGFQSAGAQRGEATGNAMPRLTEAEETAARQRSADYQAKLKERLANKPAGQPVKPAPGGERIRFKSLGD
jgi:hypothetical protein